jgi:hypothetical protein
LLRIPTDHLDVLGRLHIVWGAFGVLTGVSLAVLAVGTGGALAEIGSSGHAEQAAVWVFAVCAALLAGGGSAMVFLGRALRRHRPASRAVALALAIPNLVFVPFGTALGAYTFWVLLNDDARRVFGRPPHPNAAGPAAPVEGA